MRSSIFAIALSAGLLVTSLASADPAPAPPPPPATVAPPPDTVAPPLRPAGSEEERTAENAIYLEGLGPGLIYSINYDRSFGDFAGRIGFGYLSFSVSESDSSGMSQSTSSAAFFAIPISVSYLGIGSKRNMLELGLGATIWHIGAGGSTIDAKSSSSASDSATLVLPLGIVGYRYQPPAGGFVFRAGLSPLFAGSTIPVLPWPYLALGGAF
jgi:hypothetical protein